MLSCHVFTCIRMQCDHSTLVCFLFWLLWHVLVPIFITAHPNCQPHHCMKSASQQLLYTIGLAWQIFKFQVWMCWIVSASKACCSCYDRGAPVCVLLHMCYITSQTTHHQLIQVTLVHLRLTSNSLYNCSLQPSTRHLPSAEDKCEMQLTIYTSLEIKHVICHYTDIVCNKSDIDLDKWCTINTLHHGWCPTQSYTSLQGDELEWGTCWQFLQTDTTG